MHKLIYSHSIEDGDASSFKKVIELAPYNGYDILPQKLECVDHIQKRLGSHLRAFRQSYKNAKTTLSDKGKLTDKVINSLQNYFGQAIRQNKGEVYKTMTDVAAVLCHFTDIED